MEVIILIVPFALVIAAFFLVAFVFAVKKGQYDDLDTPAHKILFEDELTNKGKKKNGKTKA